ncbi:MAG TPA: hypothetical protein DCZ13_13615 [Porticoccaceae bacterium]|nr:hypothetical protein [Porticoccaceae bacterium]
MSFLLTFLLTLAVVLVAILVFVRVGTPIYRIDRDNVIALFELVVAGEATENDWHVFIGVPVRHDERLQDIQKTCIELTETEFIGERGRHLFSDRGMAQVRDMLSDLKRGKSNDE